jgi:hypothetical protein
VELNEPDRPGAVLEQTPNPVTELHDKEPGRPTDEAPLASRLLAARRRKPK